MSEQQSTRQSTRVIHSEAYGTFEVTDSQIFHFPKGIVGFGAYRDYALVQIEGAPFFILHALDHELSFILLQAHHAVENYGFEIDQATIDLLGIAKPEDVTTFLIVNIIEDRLYVNLKAPILLAPGNCRGCQFIIDDAAYPLRYPLARREGG